MDITSYFGTKKKKTSKSKAKPKSADDVDFPDLEEFKDQLLSWKNLLKFAINSPTFSKIHTEVRKMYSQNKCYPPPKLIFNAFRLAHLEDLKVVILGQDPYFNENQAMGLSFSVQKGVRIPPSLRNIYKCIKSDPDIKGKLRFVDDYQTSPFPSTET